MQKLHICGAVAMGGLDRLAFHFLVPVPAVVIDLLGREVRVPPRPAPKPLFHDRQTPVFIPVLGKSHPRRPICLAEQAIMIIDGPAYPRQRSWGRLDKNAIEDAIMVEVTSLLRIKEAQAESWMLHDGTELVVANGSFRHRLISNPIHPRLL